MSTNDEDLREPEGWNAEVAGARRDEYWLAMAALDQYPIDDGLPKSTSVVFRIHQLGHRSTWQPIETAPKDERLILLYGRHEGMRVGHRYGRDEEWENIDGGLLEPTHWMPLPDPPPLQNTTTVDAGSPVSESGT